MTDATSWCRCFPTSSPAGELHKPKSMGLWQQTCLAAGLPAFVLHPWQAGCGWLQLDLCTGSFSDQSGLKYQQMRPLLSQIWVCSEATLVSCFCVVWSALIALECILGSNPPRLAHSTDRLVQRLPAAPAQPLSSSCCLLISKWAILFHVGNKSL